MYLSNETEFYVDVVRRCEALGGIPAKILNVFEGAYVFAVIPQNLNGVAPYIGVERKKNNIWTYADGTPLTYQNWGLNEPDNNASNSTLCAIMDPQSGKWVSAECSFARPFLCSINGDEFQCPDGWVYNETFDYCYYLQNFNYPDAVHWQLYNWTTAEANCQRMGSHLVSIHSKAEDDFVYSLVTSNVKNLTIAAPNNYTCDYQYAWIGYYGNGTLGTGTWTDGTQVDYCASATTIPYYWMISNDPSCNIHGWAAATGISYPFARFVCKMPSKSRIAKEKLKKRNFKNL
ncbi:unnamed protein product, partial [Mesorhabditis belari]|uniref:C-type lectin domain-containing protein n=1 Tax=Mesorhabditis belari TaxID=2138241 RepID=A0AAF3J9P3_9BILA